MFQQLPPELDANIAHFFMPRERIRRACVNKWWLAELRHPRHWTKLVITTPGVRGLHSWCDTASKIELFDELFNDLFNLCKSEYIIGPHLHELHLCFRRTQGTRIEGCDFYWRFCSL